MMHALPPHVHHVHHARHHVFLTQTPADDIIVAVTFQDNAETPTFSLISTTNPMLSVQSNGDINLTDDAGKLVRIDFVIVNAGSVFSVIKFESPVARALKTADHKADKKQAWHSGPVFDNAKLVAPTQLSICHTTQSAKSRYGLYYTLDGQSAGIDPAITNGGSTIHKPPGDLHAFASDCIL
jgi:hypothetical protein